MMSDNIIPIRMIDVFGNPSPMGANHFNRIPVTDVVLVKWGETIYAPGSSKLALIDTGSDLNYCRPDIIVSAGCDRSFDTAIKTSDGTHGASVFTCGLVFPATGLVINGEVASSPLLDTPFDLIIGRQVLALGKLMMDFIADRHEFVVPRQC